MLVSGVILLAMNAVTRRKPLQMKCEDAGLICDTHRVAYINLILNILTFINELEADINSLIFMGII